MLTELTQESLERIEDNDHLHWEECAREAVEDAVNGHYTSDDHEEILEHSSPHDEWEIYCTDTSNFTLVREAMAYVAIRDDVVQKLMDEHRFE